MFGVVDKGVVLCVVGKCEPGGTTITPRASPRLPRVAMVSYTKGELTQRKSLKSGIELRRSRRGRGTTMT